MTLEGNSAPPRSRQASTSRSISKDMGEPKWADVNGIRTRYFDKGTGAAVVFFHGGNFGAPGELVNSSDLGNEFHSAFNPIQYDFS